MTRKTEWTIYAVVVLLVVGAYLIGRAHGTKPLPPTTVSEWAVYPEPGLIIKKDYRQATGVFHILVEGCQ